MAWHSLARRGKAGRGWAGYPFLCAARLGSAWSGTAGGGVVRHGSAWQGYRTLAHALTGRRGQAFCVRLVCYPYSITKSQF